VCSAVVGVVLADWQFDTSTFSLRVEASTSAVRITETPSGWPNFTSVARGLVLLDNGARTAWSSSAHPAQATSPPGETWIVAVVKGGVDVNVTVAIRATPSHLVFSIAAISVAAAASMPATVYLPYVYPAFGAASAVYSSMSGSTGDAAHAMALRVLDPLPDKVTIGVSKTVLYALWRNTTGFTAGSVALAAGPSSALRG
jgi:hypothetical protein